MHLLLVKYTMVPTVFVGIICKHPVPPFLLTNTAQPLIPCQKNEQGSAMGAHHTILASVTPSLEGERASKDPTETLPGISNGNWGGCGEGVLALSEDDKPVF